MQAFGQIKRTFVLFHDLFFKLINIHQASLGILCISLESILAKDIDKIEEV